MRISEKNSGCAVRWRLSETRFASHTAAPHLTDDDEFDDVDVGDGDDVYDDDNDDDDGEVDDDDNFPPQPISRRGCGLLEVTSINPN